jgi:Mg2+ and Co2+ transporter CorA
MTDEPTRRDRLIAALRDYAEWRAIAVYREHARAAADLIEWQYAHIDELEAAVANLTDANEKRGHAIDEALEVCERQAARIDELETALAVLIKQVEEAQPKWQKVVVLDHAYRALESSDD